MDNRTFQIICLGIGWFALIHQYFEVKGTGNFLNSRLSKRPKNPTVAAALNAIMICMGLGYLYIGEWKRFLYYLVCWQIAFLTGFPNKGEYLAVLFTIYLFSVWDVYHRAKKTRNLEYVIPRPKKAWLVYPAMLVIPSIIAATFREFMN